MSRVVAVVQARCGSVRLPRKVLAPLAGRPVVEHCLNAIRSTRLVDDVVLATTTQPADDELASLVSRLGVRVFRGSEQDVLGRFVEALRGDDADVVIRHTADDPLLDPDVIDAVVAAFAPEVCDYASNVTERSWPRGLDTEVLGRDVLERAHAEGRRPEDREHVTLFVRTHPEIFRLRVVKAPPEHTWPDLRLCIDTAEDHALLQAVFAALHQPGTTLRVGEVIEWLRAHPEVVALNADVKQTRVLGREF